MYRVNRVAVAAGSLCEYFRSVAYLQYVERLRYSSNSNPTRARREDVWRVRTRMTSRVLPCSRESRLLL